LNSDPIEFSALFRYTAVLRNGAKMQKTEHSYKYWRTRILYSTMLGYIFFYFVRKNLSLAMPEIEVSLGITKTELGVYLTAHGLLYGFSRFCHGQIADRINPRFFMAIGLFLCAVANIGFGMSSTVWAMGIFWVLNGWFQGAGFPPCAKSLTHWFAAEERGVKFAIWNTSHSIGAGIVMLVNAWAIWFFQDWRFCFFIPAVIAICGAMFLVNRLRDSPESMGLEPVEDYYNKKHHPFTAKAAVPDTPNADTETGTEPLSSVLWKHVYSNRAIWVLSFANFFVYIVRFSILDWAPTFLKQAKGLEIHQAGMVSSVYELIGVLGMLSSGYLMDRVFRGRGSRVCFLYMLGCTAAMTLFWYADSKSILVNSIFLGVLGFFIYCPQCLIGVIVANLATKKAAAAANGLTGIFGYASTAVTGIAVGWIAQHYDWNAVFLCLIASSALAAVLFLFAWNAVSPEQLEKEK
jgi:OPA family glycerol-3-phosphate transporter-like MFS transporter/OPA family sugar phosphate sensor protein UhpC-like MFS transporter